MYAESTPLSRGSGTSSFEPIPKSLIATPGLSPAAGTGHRIWNRATADDIRFSGPAVTAFGNDPVDASSFEAAGASPLIAAARGAHQFLSDHPRLADSAFGKSVTLLVRATLHLEKDGGFDSLPEESRDLVLRAVEQAAGFLDDHPRVADSAFGRAVAEMAEAIAKSIRVDAGAAGPQPIDWLLEAAKRADAYLDEYPVLASMPLGEVVSRLLDGVKSLADGNPLDADLQTLAKRVGYFLESHPRLAQSAFGQLIAPLVRGLVAIDVSALPEAEPPAVGKIIPETRASVVLDVTSRDAQPHAMQAAA